MSCLRIVSVIVASFMAASAWAADPWPGETWSASTDLTFLSPTGWSTNLSGAYWNPVTRRLWVANNSGNFSSLKEDGLGSFAIEHTFSPGGDLEGITQADPSADRVYLMVERANVIREYVASTGVLNRTWDLTSLVGGMADPNDGTEGIAFVPDVWLSASGFRDGSGNLYLQSVHGVNGLGGIMLVAVQDVSRATAGYVYAVDLINDGTWTTVGRYKTSRDESCDLAFDASVGRLYVLHNIDGNILEVADLTSAPFGADRKFTTLREFQVPSGSNIEGFAITPALKSDNTLGDRSCFYTDDNNAQGALRWFKQLPSPLSINTGNSQTAPVSTAVDVAPSVRVQDAFQNPLSSFAISFQVTAGGGSISGGSSTTNSSGIATLENWTLGANPGANSLSVTGTGLNGSPLAFTATGTDVTRPTVASIARQTPAGASTSAASVTWRVTFSEHINDVAADDFTLVDVASSITSESITGVSATSGTTIDVTANTGSGDGTLRLEVPAATATITNDLGNSLTASYASGQPYAIDRTLPSVSIGAPSVSTTGAGPVSYTISYTGADIVTLANADVTLDRFGTANGTVAVSGSGTVAQTVTISSISGDGTLGISIAANSASDNAGNQALAAGPSATFAVTKTVSTVSIGRVAAGSDDAEESAAGGVSLTSGDLELVNDGSLQTVGLRFSNLAIPRGATISTAWVQFQADEAQSEATALTIKGQVGNAAAFTSAARNVSLRPRTTALALWSPVPWNTVGEAGAPQRTSELKDVVQEVVSGGSWASGSALALILTGTGHRTAESFEGLPGAAALLHVEYTTGTPVNQPPVVDAGPARTITQPAQASLDGTVADDGIPTPTAPAVTWSVDNGPLGGVVTFVNLNAVDTQASFTLPGSYLVRLTAPDGLLSASDTTRVTVLPTGTVVTFEARVAAGVDDAEQAAGGAVTVSSSDLELVNDGNLQTVGVRFRGVTIPRGSVISRAWVQFQADEAQSEATALTIQGEASDNAAIYTTAARSISTRARTVESVAWTPAAWNVVGAAGADQQTPDLAAVIQKIVSRGGWTSGNALALVFTGTGHRTAESYEGLAAAAPRMHVEYTTPAALAANEAEPVASSKVEVALGPTTARIVPNPLRDRGTIELALGRAGAVRIELYDVQGRRLRTLLDERSLAAGRHTIELGQRLTPGLYFYRVQAPDRKLGGRAIVLE